MRRAHAGVAHAGLQRAILRCMGTRAANMIHPTRALQVRPPPPYHPGLLRRKGRIYTWAPARCEDSRAIEPHRILEAGASLGLLCFSA